MNSALIQRISASEKGMVTSQHYAASEAGAEILADGGNAVDAAVATALALSVCEPQACGLGGQTMMLVHMVEKRKTIFLDGSSHAPNRAMNDHFQKKRSRLRGYRAATTPSTPATLEYACKEYGRLPFSRLLEPAIRLAENGFTVSKLFNSLQTRELDHFKDGNAGSIFLDNGKPLPEGSVLKQPALAQTLKLLAKKGVDEFYQGNIAKAIHDDMEKNEGFIRQDDLGSIPWPIERRPVSCRLDDMRIISIPPPGAGRTLIHMLNVMSHFPDKERNFDTPNGAALLAEIIRRSQLDRRDRPYDPNFYQQVDDRAMLSDTYAKLVAKQVKARLLMKKSAPLGITDGQGIPIPEPSENSGETTHLSVMDKDGNVVGLTQSIERVFGSFCVTEELGFLYNNYMSAFEYQDYTHPYYLKPNAVPWASVAPTIVYKGRKPWLVLGSPGSERIVSSVFQIIFRLLKQSPLDAVVAPRLHCSASGKVSLEAPWMRDDIPAFLEEKGFKIDKREAFSFFMGCIQLVMRQGKSFVGVADPRRDGSAVGGKK